MSPDLKQNLLSVSSSALRTCLKHLGLDISFDKLHKTHRKCTPNQISFYLLAQSLYKRLNFDAGEVCFETTTVLDQMICTGRQSKYQTFTNNKRKIGLNTTANKFFPLNNQILLEHLNLSPQQFKKLAKIQFLKYGKT